MAEIHWGIWLAVGLIITLVSIFLEGLKLFIIVGILFMAVGIAKYMIGKKVRAGRKSAERKYKKCPYCGAWNYPSAGRCHHCSKKL